MGGEVSYTCHGKSPSEPPKPLAIPYDRAMQEGETRNAGSAQQGGGGMTETEMIMNRQSMIDAAYTEAVTMIPERHMCAWTREACHRHFAGHCAEHPRAVTPGVTRVKVTVPNRVHGAYTMIGTLVRVRGAQSVIKIVSAPGLRAGERVTVATARMIFG